MRLWGGINAQFMPTVRHPSTCSTQTD